MDQRSEGNSTVSPLSPGFVTKLTVIKKNKKVLGHRSTQTNEGKKWYNEGKKWYVQKCSWLIWAQCRVVRVHKAVC